MNSQSSVRNLIVNNFLPRAELTLEHTLDLFRELRRNFLLHAAQYKRTQNLQPRRREAAHAE